MKKFENDSFPEPAEELPQGLTARQIFSRTGWSYLIILGAATAVQFLFLAYAPMRLDSSWVTYMLSFAPIYLAGLPLGWLILRRLPAGRPEDHRLTLGHFMTFLLMCFPIMYIGNLIGLGVNSLIASARGSIYENPVYDLLQGTNVWASLLFVVILAPVMEELIFRKLLCDRVRVYGEGTAILVSGLVFGLFHGNFSQFFYAFGIGSLFAYVYLRTGRVRYTMLLHGCVNFFGGVLPEVLLKQIDLDALAKFSMKSPEQMFVYVRQHMSAVLGLTIYVLTALSLFIVGFVFLLSRRKQAVLLPTEKQLPETGRFQTVFLNAGMLFYFAGSVCMMVFMTIKLT